MRLPFHDKLLPEIAVSPFNNLLLSPFLLLEEAVVYSHSQMAHKVNLADYSPFSVLRFFWQP